MNLNIIAENFASTVWGLPMVICLFLAGLIFSVYFFFPQIRLFKHSIDITMGKYDKPEDKGEISHFQALCAALSATIGLGNIAGVAVAITSGGPGAVFWMWVAGFFGMATKFTSISLSLLNRTINPESGMVHGGPMYTIKNGLPKKYYPLAILFSIFTIGGAFGAGNLFQSNQMASILETTYKIPKEVTGGLFMVLTGFVLIGGIKRIGQVASKLVPSMVVIYFLGSIGVLVMHYEMVPRLLLQIIHDAFSGTAAIGGFAGIAFKEVVIQGVRRAVFSNEAGLGSAAMAHSAAKSSPIQEGIVGMLGPFIDTIVVCTLTALVLLITGVWTNAQGIQGSELTAMAFAQVYGNIGIYMLSLSIVLFAFSSIISWSYYGEQGVAFLFGDKGIAPYRYVFTMIVFVGAIMKLDVILNISDGFLGLMLIPNLLANILLARQLKKNLKQYEADLKAGRV
jgi:AGCS family alanine or glycine:cation symporter